MNELVIGLALGFLVCSQLALAGATAYVLRRYVYLPWKTVRADQVALTTALANITQELGARKVVDISPEQQAIAEQKFRMRRNMRALNDE